jgi:sulfate/thiosulfate transport system permease protein
VVVESAHAGGGDLMSQGTSILSSGERSAQAHGGGGISWTRLAFVILTVAFVALFLLLPLVSIFWEALRPLKAGEMAQMAEADPGRQGSALDLYWEAITDGNSVHAIKMTLLVAAIVVPLNTVFGVAAAWAIAKFNFRGKALLMTVIDIPFAVSPVISGMIFVLLFGRAGLLGPWLIAHGIHIIFAWPGMVLATLFVSFPFVARELIPLMQEQGSQEEQAAISLGASGWQTFRRVTLPNIKWGLLYGVLLCNARAMGEFGAVSVVTQPMPGEQNTLPREIEYLYTSYSGPGFRGAFALASLLAMLGLVTLIAKAVLEWKMRRDRRAAGG